MWQSLALYSFSVYRIILHNKHCECAWCSTFSIHCIIPNVAANLGSVSFYFRGSFTNRSFRALIVCSILICLWPFSFCVAVLSAYPEKKQDHAMCCLKKAGNKICIGFPARISFLPCYRKKRVRENKSFQSFHYRSRKTTENGGWVAHLLLPGSVFKAPCNIQPSPHSNSSISSTFASSPAPPPLPPPPPLLPSSSPDKPRVFSKESEH